MNMRTSAALAALVGAASVAGSADGAVVVLGGQLAEACSRAAMAGEYGRQHEDLCTMALDTENLRPRDRAGTLVNRGVMRIRRKEWSDALDDLRVAERLKSNMGEIYVNRGAVYIAQGKFEESLEQISKGMALGVEEPAKAYYNRALAYESVGDVKAAYFDYKKSVELDPKWGEAERELRRFTVSSR